MWADAIGFVFKVVVVHVVVFPQIGEDIFGRFAGVNHDVNENVDGIPKDESREKMERKSAHGEEKESEKRGWNEQGQRDGHRQNVFDVGMNVVHAMDFVLPVVFVFEVVAGVIEETVKDIFCEGEGQHPSEEQGNFHQQWCGCERAGIAKNGDGQHEEKADDIEWIGVRKFVQRLAFVERLFGGVVYMFHISSYLMNQMYTWKICAPYWYSEVRKVDLRNAQLSFRQN